MDIHLKFPEDFRYWYEITLMIRQLPNFYYTIQMDEKKTWVKFDSKIPGETKTHCKEILKLVKKEIFKWKEE